MSKFKLSLRGVWAWWFITIIVGIGLVILFLSYFIFSETSPKWHGFTRIIGLSIFTSGVFSAILKAFQFIGIFKEALIEVIYKPKFLAVRNDIMTIWRDVSKIVYKEKFPEINEEIEHIIITEYFPTKHTYYNENYQIRGKYRWTGINDYIQLNETHEFKIKVIDKGRIETLENYHTINKLSKDDNRALIEIISLKVNEEEKLHLTKIDTFEDDSIKKILFRIKLEGEPEYNIRIKIKKIYSIIANPTKSFKTLPICKGLQVMLNFPDDLKFKFQEAGTIEKFDEQPGLGDNILCRKYDGIVLPQQGFVIALLKQ